MRGLGYPTGCGGPDPGKSIRLVSRTGNWTVVVFILVWFLGRVSDLRRATKDFSSQSFGNSIAAKMKLLVVRSGHLVLPREFTKSALPNGCTSGKLVVR